MPKKNTDRKYLGRDNLLTTAQRNAFSGFIKMRLQLNNYSIKSVADKLSVNQVTIGAVCYRRVGSRKIQSGLAQCCGFTSWEELIDAAYTAVPDVLKEGSNG